MSQLRVTVSSVKCQSYKRCMALAPAVFGVAGDGKAAVLHPEAASQEEILKAARSCPYRAIAVVVNATGEQLFPPLPRAASS